MSFASCPALASIDSNGSSLPASASSSFSPLSPSSSSPSPSSLLSCCPPFSPPSSCVVRFTNCRLLRSHHLIKEDLWYCNGTIIDPQKRFWEASSLHTYAAHYIIDCGGMIVAPGMIDIQLNGAFGVDFSSVEDMGNKGTLAPPAASDGPLDDKAQKSRDPLTYVSRCILTHGVTSFCPTLITSPPSSYHQLLPLFKPRVGSRNKGANVLGVHLEGPFITVPGAHPQQYIQNHLKKKEGSDPTPSLNSPSSGPSSPSPSSSSSFRISEDVLLETYGPHLRDYVAIITAAPEIPGLLETVASFAASPAPCSSSSSSPCCSLSRIVFSAGHTNCDYSQAVEAWRVGVKSITHLFNAMHSFHHRDPGLVGLVATSSSYVPASPTSPSSSSVPSSSSSSSVPSSLYYGIIADGTHTHPASINLAYRSRPEGCVLVTDAMSAMGLNPGVYNLGKQVVTIEPSLPSSSSPFPSSSFHSHGDYKAVLSGTSTLAGSIARMDICLRKFLYFTACSPVQALEAASLHPAQLLGIEGKKGRIDFGCDADLIIVNDELEIIATFIGGELAYLNPSNQIKIKKNE